jgi:twitching motility protein PilJ
MLRNLKIWQRLLLVAISFSVPILLLLVLLVREQGNSINFAKKEREGVLFLKPSRDLLSHLMLHRDMHISVLSGENSFSAKLMQLQLDIEDDLKALNAESSKLPQYANTAAQLKKIEGSWGELKSKLPAMSSFSAEQSVEGHGRVIRHVVSFLVVMGNESKLVLDPDVDSYYCMDAVIFRIPKLNNDISRLRSQSVNTLLLGLAADGTRREQLKLLSGTVEESLSTQRDNIEYGLLANPTLGSMLRALVEVSASNTSNFLSIISRDIIVAATPQIQPLGVFDSASKAIESNFGLYDSAAGQLDELLRVRIEGFTQNRLFTLGIVALSLLFSLGLVVLLLRSITSPIAELSRIAEKISLGELDEEIKIAGKDELAELSEKFKRMQTSLKAAMEHLDSKDPL